MNFFGGYDNFVDILGGHYKIELYLGFISMHFRVFSLGQGTEWGFFFGLCFGVTGRCWALAYI